MPIRPKYQRPPRSTITQFFASKETGSSSASQAPGLLSSDGKQPYHRGEGSLSEKKHGSLHKAVAQPHPKKQRTETGEQATPTELDSDPDADQKKKMKESEAMKQGLEENATEPPLRSHHEESHQDQEECPSPRLPHTNLQSEREREQGLQPTKHQWVYIQGCSETELDQAIAELPDNFSETLVPNVNTGPPSPRSPQCTDDRLKGEAR